ncbi:MULTISPECIES: asparaginase domain-containing protein [Rathayibacter]|uniref:L-asparaginase n=2 Tax=Rathayibacter festucae TaxID=110937 RepID=A0A3Q9V2B7_9MICO|nr:MULTISPECIES: asparaginase domain-containing protein [Rathayibacter]NQX15611.1 asparaginase [Rathayibacter sp. VKM Ac-2857]NRG40671.1 asparaginase [Rathayibacter sp. VKM Ac-2835]AZZ53882.1 L-asparaginase [Rathayibacter festucae DSM 15932]MCJ1674775.1 asparaginase [Rathayibacter sp. VKM Ac-2929]MCJ1683774.1 asparaginase [Rathayibacter sp. VKM Ac-2928]
MSDRILVLTTGGTIDKEYSLAGELEIGAPTIPRLLEPVLSTLEFRVEEVLRKDSLDLDDADRALIRERVLSAEEDRIVLTHGTDTMTLTAEALGAVRDRVVVLTGAMQPARMRDSDAAFNLGAAVAAVQLLPPGVYLAMSGRVLPAGAVVKDRAAGIFLPA